MELSFKHRTILVTGATRGIGKQIANDLGRLGATLLLTGTNPDEIEELNRKARTEKNGKRYFCLDLMKDESLAKFLVDLEEIPVIDGLVNNAGINRLNALQDVVLQDWDDMLAVNLTAPFQIIRVLSKKMIANGYGRIINVGSIFSKISKERRSVYSATKFGIHGLTVGASNDLARYNILINTLSPGFILTELTKKNLSEMEMADLKNMIPAKRLGNVNEISKVAVFLMSDLNQYLTGQNIIVDGGFTNV
jgi:3-oxoacyl-[acyl-carrier protein] reductase